MTKSSDENMKPFTDKDLDTIERVCGTKAPIGVRLVREIRRLQGDRDGWKASAMTRGGAAEALAEEVQRLRVLRLETPRVPLADDREFDQGHNEAVETIAKIIPSYGTRYADLLSAVRGMWRSVPPKLTPSRCDMAFDAGAAAEREACAKIADEEAGDGLGLQETENRKESAEAIAKAIRARGKA